MNISMIKLTKLQGTYFVVLLSALQVAAQIAYSMYNICNLVFTTH